MSAELLAYGSRRRPAGFSIGSLLDKAGSYAIQGGASRFVTRVERCYFNVMGLPVARVDRLLRDWDAL